jgi:tRNA nucleotidyltransferase (CCA-adding enzyme)
MARRDFTINAMYWNHLVGLVCSKQSFEDIKNYKLRFIGNPEDRIKEDGLRVMRFYRILKSKNLTPDEKSLRAVRTNFDKMLQVSSHRIMMEIERICL